MTEPMTEEENAQFAIEVIIPLMAIIDNAVVTFDLEKLKATLSNMDQHASTLAAWPFPETMNEAKQVALKNVLFKEIIRLMEARKELMQYKPDFLINNDLLKICGMLR